MVRRNPDGRTHARTSACKHARTHIYKLSESNFQMTLLLINLLPDRPNLGSSDSTANEDMMSKIWKN